MRAEFYDFIAHRMGLLRGKIRGRIEWPPNGINVRNLNGLKPQNKTPRSNNINVCTQNWAFTCCQTQTTGQRDLGYDFGDTSLRNIMFQ